MKASLERRVTGGFILLLVLLAVSGLAAWRSVRSQLEAERWVDHSYQVRLELNRMQEAVQRFQLESRNYALTGDAPFERDFLASAEEARVRLRSLKDMTADNPLQQARLARMDTLLEAKIAVAREVMRLSRQHSSLAALDLLLQGRGKEAIERVLEGLRTLDSTEARLLAERSARERDIQRRALFTIATALLLGLAGASLSLLAVRREMARRRRLQARLEASAADLARSERALRDQKRLLESVLQNMGSGVLVADANGKILLSNAASRRFTGEQGDGADLGEYTNRFGVFLPDGVTPFPPERLPLKSALRGESTDDLGMFIRSAAHPEGRQYSFTGRPLLGDGGELEGGVIVFHDVTERTEAERRNRELGRALERRAGELEAANRELEAFSYSVSHDLRAPLRHIDGFVQLLLARDPGGRNDQDKRYLDIIAGATKRMDQLISALLNFSRMGRQGLAPGKVDLGDLARDCRRELEAQAAGREVAWDIRPLPAVEGDPSLLRQVLANLMGNALKYSRDRNPARVTVEPVDAGPGEVAVAVRDNGVGFDMRYADKLFGVFQRLHTAEEFEGTGIGLATVRRIVHKHGGRTWAEGEPGRGASFYFGLPAGGPAKEGA